MHILLIGTEHSYQMPNCSDSIKFQTFIEEICRTRNVCAIAEEYSIDALKEKGIDETVCRRAANTAGIIHAYCDPDISQRLELGIAQESDIRARQVFNKEINVASELNTSHRKREQFWLDRVLELNCSPTMFICGANHVDRFQSLLTNHEISVQVIAHDWPNI